MPLVAARLVDLVPQPPHRRLGRGEQHPVLHVMVELDEPAAAAVKDGDVAPAIGVRPEILYMLEYLHGFAS